MSKPSYIAPPLAGGASTERLHVIMHATSTVFIVGMTIAIVVIGLLTYDRVRTIEDTLIEYAADATRKVVRYYEAADPGAGSAVDVRGFCESFRGDDLARLLRSVSGALDALSRTDMHGVNQLIERAGDERFAHDLDSFAALSSVVSSFFNRTSV